MGELGFEDNTYFYRQDRLQKAQGSKAIGKVHKSQLLKRFQSNHFLYLKPHVITQKKNQWWFENVMSKAKKSLQQFRLICAICHLLIHLICFLHCYSPFLTLFFLGQFEEMSGKHVLQDGCVRGREICKFKNHTIITILNCVWFNYLWSFLSLKRCLCHIVFLLMYINFQQVRAHERLFV